MPEVRLIDAEGKQVGIIPTARAQVYADEAALDLVEIVRNETPTRSVCKLLDYGKHKYRENKKRHEARVKQKQIMVKEVKFRLSTGAADYETKIGNVKRFLERGDKVKVSLWFRGREIVKSKLGYETMERVAADVADMAVVEQDSKLEGKRLLMMLVPRRDAQGKGKNA